MAVQRKILVVDDDANVREMLSYQLRNAGYEVADAASGEVAIDLLRHDSYDLVLLDLIMPGKPGVEVLREIQAMNPFQWCIVISGLADVWQKREPEIRPYAVVQKPIDFPRLASLIEAAFR